MYSYYRQLFWLCMTCFKYNAMSCKYQYVPNHLKKRSLASCYSFYERMDSIGSFLKQKLNGAVLNWVTMNQG